MPPPIPPPSASSSKETATSPRIVLLPSSTRDCLTDGARHTRLSRMQLPQLCKINEINTGDKSSNGQWKHGIMARLAVWMMGLPYEEKYINHANELCKTTTGSMKERANKIAGHGLGKSVRGDYLFLILRHKFPDATRNAKAIRIRYRDELGYSSDDGDGGQDDHEEETTTSINTPQAQRQQDTGNEDASNDRDVAFGLATPTFSGTHHKRQFKYSRPRTANFPRNRARATEASNAVAGVTEEIGDQDDDETPSRTRKQGTYSESLSHGASSPRDLDENESLYTRDDFDDIDYINDPTFPSPSNAQNQKPSHSSDAQSEDDLDSQSDAVPFPDPSARYSEEEICDNLEAALAHIHTSQRALQKKDELCDYLKQKLARAEAEKALVKDGFLNAVDVEKAWADKAAQLRPESPGCA